MIMFMKITGQLLTQVQCDLERPHPFAFERVGFLFVKQGTIENDNKLLLTTYYMSIPDEQYIPDPTVGARYNSDAIRGVMQRILDTEEGAFHIHMHSPFFPVFSSDDRANQQRLMPAFRNVGMKGIHGAILLTEHTIVGLCWLPGEKNPQKISRIHIIDRPCKIY